MYCIIIIILLFVGMKMKLTCIKCCPMINTKVNQLTNHANVYSCRFLPFCKALDFDEAI